jgi:hypothetical protein
VSLLVLFGDTRRLQFILEVTAELVNDHEQGILRFLGGFGSRISVVE